MIFSTIKTYLTDLKINVYEVNSYSYVIKRFFLFSFFMAIITVLYFVVSKDHENLLTIISFYIFYSFFHLGFQLKKSSDFMKSQKYIYYSGLEESKDSPCISKNDVEVIKEFALDKIKNNYNPLLFSDHIEIVSKDFIYEIYMNISFERYYKEKIKDPIKLVRSATHYSFGKRIHIGASANTIHCVKVSKVKKDGGDYDFFYSGDIKEMMELLQIENLFDLTLEHITLYEMITL